MRRIFSRTKNSYQLAIKTILSMNYINTRLNAVSDSFLWRKPLYSLCL